MNTVQTLALKHIADSDPGSSSKQSLAHEMALIAKQALDYPIPGEIPLGVGGPCILGMDQPRRGAEILYRYTRPDND